MISIILDKERKENIDQLVDRLKTEYDSQNGFDYDSLCEDYNIRYYEDPRIVFPCQCNSIEGEEKFIFNHSSRFKSLHNYIKAHEFGHAILNHTSELSQIDEAEADYFAECFNKTNWAISLSRHFLTIPLDFVFRWPSPLLKICNKSFYKNYMVTLKEVSDQQPVHPKT